MESAQPVKVAARCHHGHEVRGPGAGLDRSRYSHSMYRVLLTGADLRLIQACSSWICRFQPDPPIRARFAHLEQQLAGARPMEVSAGSDR